MRPLTRFRIVVEHPVRFALLALALAFVSCQDERSITDARHAHRLAASMQATTAGVHPTADAFLGLDATNYSTGGVLATYTRADDTIAHAIVMKVDLSRLPAGSAITHAPPKLRLPAGG